MAEVLCHTLSKNAFMPGCESLKRLWLHKYMPDVRDEMYKIRQAIYQSCTDVVMPARNLLPGVVDASPVRTIQYQQSVADTARFIAESKTGIYQAAFQVEGILCAVDML